MHTICASCSNAPVSMLRCGPATRILHPLGALLAHTVMLKHADRDNNSSSRCASTTRAFQNMLLYDQALEAVEGEKWTLEGQKSEMLRQQQRHLAWSGQALIAGSVSVMEEAVDQIRATFLFTSKELKCGRASHPCCGSLSQSRKSCCRMQEGLTDVWTNERDVTATLRLMCMFPAGR